MTDSERWEAFLREQGVEFRRYRADIVASIKKSYEEVGRPLKYGEVVGPQKEAIDKWLAETEASLGEFDLALVGDKVNAYHDLVVHFDKDGKFLKLVSSP